MKESLKKIIDNNSYFKLENFLIHSEETLDFFKSIGLANFENIKDTIEVSTYSTWNNILIKHVSNIKQRISSFLEIDLENIGEFNLFSFEENISFSKISCLENTTEYSLFLFPNSLEYTSQITFSNAIRLDINSFTLLIVKNYEIQKCIDNLSFSIKNGFVLIGYILDDSFIKNVIEQNNTRKLTNSKSLLFNLEQSTDYSKDDIVGYLSSLYSVCSCRIDKINKRKIISYNKFTSKSDENLILSYHFVCSDGSFSVTYEKETHTLSKGQILSINNNTNSKSLQSDFSIVNLLDDSKLDIYALYLNKIK